SRCCRTSAGSPVHSPTPRRPLRRPKRITDPSHRPRAALRIAFLLASLAGCHRGTLPVLGTVPSFALTERGGETLRAEDLAGHVFRLAGAGRRTARGGGSRRPRVDRVFRFPPLPRRLPGADAALPPPAARPRRRPARLLQRRPRARHARGAARVCHPCRRPP